MKLAGKKAWIVLSLPRCGTHFIWSRLVQSGRYQLIYDADRIAALDVLASRYKGTLDFMWPVPRNPNYNFQYNSLKETREPMSAEQHLEQLKMRYSEDDSFSLFRKLLELQNNADRTLFSVNRFVYTCGNDRFRGSGFEWTSDLAMEALSKLHDWFGRVDCSSRFVLVIRKLDDWIASQVMFSRSDEKIETLRRRLTSVPRLLQICADKNIPVYFMDQVIETMNRGELDFDRATAPLSAQDLKEFGERACEESGRLEQRRSTKVPTLFRLQRFMQYLREPDPIKRTSLVRSIGYLPARFSSFIPGLGRKINEDLEGLVLDNSSIVKYE